MSERNVSSLLDKLNSANRERALHRDKQRGGGDNGGNGGEPPMSQLEARVEHLERDVGDIKVILARMEGRFDAIDAKLDSFATKTEMAKLETRVIKWSVGTILAAGGLVFAIMRFLPPA